MQVVLIPNVFCYITAPLQGIGAVEEKKKSHQILKWLIMVCNIFQILYTLYKLGLAQLFSLQVKQGAFKNLHSDHFERMQD